MSEPFEPRDPFGLTPDVEWYVPRPASDAAFDALCRRVLDEAGLAVLSGPAGLGKTLLLRRLAERARAQLCPVYLPYAALAPDELCQWTLAALDAEPSDDPIGVLRAYARHLHEAGSALVLLVDDALVMPPATARWLGHLVATSGGAVRAALATGDHPSAGRIIAALGEGAEVVRLTAPMNGDETRDYVRARLARARLPEARRALFDEETLSRVQRVSGGVPRRVHAAASAVLRGEDPESIGEFLDGVVPEREGARILEDRDTEVRPAIADLEPEEEAGEDEVEIEDLDLDIDLALDPGRPRLERPPLRRVEPGPGLRWVLATALAIAAAAVAIPLLLSQGPGGPGPGFEPSYEPRRLAPPAPEPEPEPPRPRAPDRPAPGAAPPLPARGPEPPDADALGFDTPEREGRLGLLEEPIEPTPDTPELAATAGPETPAEREAATPEPAVAEPSGTDEPAPPGAAGPFPVNINATPWARIEVDGVAVGETPLAGLPLLAGEHTFRAHMPDGRVLERVVEIDAEERFVSFE